jgi:putative transposase
VIVAYIDGHRDEFGVEPICEVLQVAPSTYYAAKSRPASTRALRDASLIPQLVALWEANYRVYGARKLWRAAQRAGMDVGRDQVARLMRSAGIYGVRRGKRVRTTRADERADRPPDLVERNFTATAPNQLWVTDLTYVPTWAGVAYVCFITDVFSRSIVGWRVASNMRTTMVLDAIEMARWSRGTNLAGLRCHSDAGSQGGINWSSQHLDMEVVDEQAAGVDGDVEREAVDAVTGKSSDSPRVRAGVLGEDRRGAIDRGCCRRVRRVGGGGFALVPAGWRDAHDRAERPDWPLPVVR